MEKGNERGEKKKKTTNWRGCGEEKKKRSANTLCSDPPSWSDASAPSSLISSVLWSFMNPSFCPFTPLLLEQTPQNKRDKELCTISKACGLKGKKNRSIKCNINRKQSKSRQEGDKREKRGNATPPCWPHRGPLFPTPIRGTKHNRGAQVVFPVVAENSPIHTNAAQFPASKIQINKWHFFKKHTVTHSPAESGSGFHKHEKIAGSHASSERTDTDTSTVILLFSPPTPRFN